VTVLDTHAWVWWVADPGRLPPAVRRHIAGVLERGAPLHVSAISAWEVAMLVQRRRLELTMDVAAWVARCEAAPELAFVPVDNRIALRSVSLPDFPHGDPADRIIVATALDLDAALVTGDRRLRGYAPVASVWD
jgi:PIN domain nuclease of toxin-antitoxin system